MPPVEGQQSFRIPGMRTSRRAEDLACFQSDADVAGAFAPLCIVRPAGLADIERLVGWANSAGTGIVPVSSTGRRRRGDTVPARENVVVADMSGMKGVLNVDGRDRVAIIEPGVDFGMIDGVLSPHGLRAYRPLGARAGKSVLASYLERSPIINPHDHWDVTDPFGGTMLVLGDGNIMPTGGAVLEGSLKSQLERGHRHIFSASPGTVDPLRLLQGAQGTLGIMAWAAISCERLPAFEESWFVSTDRAAPLVALARDLLHRRLGSALFLLDSTELALLLAGDAAEFRTLRQALPAWTLFVSLSAGTQAPDAKMAWQRADLVALAASHGVQPTADIARQSAADFAARLRQPHETAAFDRVLGDHEAVFFLTQLHRIEEFVGIARRALDGAGFAEQVLGTYVQPMAQGVFAHLELTAAHGLTDGAQRAALRDAMLVVARACAAEGAMFSRPYGAWADFAFDGDPALRPVLKAAKSILDPAGVMNPGRFPY